MKKKMPKMSRMKGMMKAFENSKYDVDTKSAPEGSPKDRQRDAAQMAKMKAKKK